MTELDLAAIERRARGGWPTSHDVQDLVDEVRRAHQALTALQADRNTWARQLADLRDELDTARAQAENDRQLRLDAESERELETARADVAEARLALVRDYARSLRGVIVGPPDVIEQLGHVGGYLLKLLSTQPDLAGEGQSRG